MKDLLKFLDNVPEQYKTGPWSLFARLYLVGYITVLAATYSEMVSSFDRQGHSDLYPWLPQFRLCAGVYCCGILGVMLYRTGPGPLVSYTMTSWNLLTLRLLSSWLGSLGFLWAYEFSNILLFPSLVMNTITVLIWWLVLVPLISYLSKSPKAKKEFWSFNTSFMLVNIHFLNLILAGVDFLTYGRELNIFDLWMGLVVALVYIIFYLFVLDPAGWHFYIILTPRTPWCVVVYSGILGLYYGFYLMWNEIVFILHK
jgi:hypothetical protein